MTTERALQALEQVFVRAGYSVRTEVRVENVRFDLVAEDDTKIVFLEIKLHNVAWFDEFSRQQAAVGSALSDVPLGQKWRDVYVVVLTMDAVDTKDEQEIAEAIRSDTTVARKLIIDASRVDLSDASAIEGLLGPLLGPFTHPIYAAETDVMESLITKLHDENIDDAVVRRLALEWKNDQHDSLQLIIEALK